MEVAELRTKEGRNCVVVVVVLIQTSLLLVARPSVAFVIRTLPRPTSAFCSDRSLRLSRA